MPQLEYLSVPVVGDSYSDGRLNVLSTQGMAKGAHIFLMGDGLEHKALIIDDVYSRNVIFVKELNTHGSVRFNCSQYGPENNAKVVQPEQHSLTYPEFTGKASTMTTISSDEVTITALINTVGILSNRIDILEQKVNRPNWFRRLMAWFRAK